ncbi:hypothetical protein LEP1GSC109_3037 [Leptospira interrogans str. UI 13372]|uniref:Uncharacterized protein n=1 Tax=Leptospira interrogans str. UI 12621 TaxID=1049937 RepID=A0A0F6HDY3_LEPIR|nr:hypothetical protein LEP1GSC104_3153 [Leptospira interrogans str. UI 12621]EMO96484.1 hypothetical protein LEP1GSC109_3037 [Leptospira interrogans str. UI 13372]
MILKKFLWNNSLFGKSFAVVFIFYSSYRTLFSKFESTFLCL